MPDRGPLWRRYVAALTGTRPRPRRRGEPMPQRFCELADYNSRVRKGIVHTAEYAARMAALKADFGQWSAEAFARETGQPVPSGSTEGKKP